MTQRLNYNGYDLTIGWAFSTRSLNSWWTGAWSWWAWLLTFSIGYVGCHKLMLAISFFICQLLEKQVLVAIAFLWRRLQSIVLGLDGCNCIICAEPKCNQCFNSLEDQPSFWPNVIATIVLAPIGAVLCYQFFERGPPAKPDSSSCHISATVATGWGW